MRRICGTLSRLVFMAAMPVFMTILLLAGLAGGAAGPALAQDKPDCKNPQTQTDMTICAGLDYDEADAQLNRQYQTLRKALVARDTSMDDSSRGAPEALVAAQRAWVVYRDANCKLSGFQARGGTMEPMLVANCLATMSRARTDDLRKYGEGF